MQNVNARTIERRGDMVFENGCLFLRDGLLSRLFADAIKSGDSGLVILVEMLHLYKDIQEHRYPELAPQSDGKGECVRGN